MRRDGKTMWLDPTLSYQGGGLTNRFVSRLGQALVVQPGVTALEKIPPPPTDRPRQRVLSTFQIPDYKSPVGLTVETTYRDYSADYQREELARTHLDELGRNYLNYYARLYPGIESTQPPAVRDDRANNVLVVTEQYQIRELWKLSPDTKKREAEFRGDSLVNLLTDPKTRLRTMPLRLPFPLRREHEIVIHLPDPDWTLPPKEKTIDHDAFLFHYHRTLTGKVLRYRFDLETRTPELPPQKVADYLARLDEMETDVGEKLERPDDGVNGIKPGTGNLNWLMVFIALFGGAFTLAAMIWAWRSTRVSGDIIPPELSPEEKQLRGIGGWLVLVGIGLFSGPIARLFVLMRNWEGYFSLHVWQSVAMPQSAQYHPLYAPLLVVEMLGNIGILGLSLLTLGFFLQKRKAFPKTFILLFWANAFFLIADELCCRQIPALAKGSNGDSIQTMARALFMAGIWSGYMLKSRRVKITFIR